MTDEQIKYMVDRFLGWRLPETFNPDCGISFKRTHSEQGPIGPQKYEPSGTNLFDAQQATAMVRYMIDGMALSASPAPGTAKEGKWMPSFIWIGLGFVIIACGVIWQANQPVPRCEIVGDREFYNGRCIPYCPPHPSECD